MNDQLLIGIVLIGIGVLLAILAYMFLSNREGQEKQTGKGTGQEPRPAESQPPGPQTTLATSDSAGSKTPSNSEIPAESNQDSPASTPAKPPSAGEVVAPASTPAKGERIQVATLLRDEVSGKLIVQVDDVEYEDREALKDSRHWTRVEYAARDLSDWVKAQKPKAAAQTDRPIEPPDLKPKSMIEQIDQILQDRIEASGRSDLAVRLTEGPGGTARVLIGVNSYEIADVPNSEIQKLIREAVAAWESTQ